MGFEFEDTEYELKFEDPKLDGLIVRMRSLTIGELLDLQMLFDEATNGELPVSSVDKLLAKMAASLVSWNVTRHGKAVPATLAGIRAQNLGAILRIIQAWMGVIADVPPPLSSSSNGTGQLDLERSMPMAPLSPSLSS